MYSIAVVIFGLPLCGEDFTQNCPKLHALLEDDYEPDALKAYYHGGGCGTPRAVGVEVGQFDDATVAHVAVTELPLHASVEQIADAHREIDDLITQLHDDGYPDEAKELEAIRHTAETFLLWTTS